ncbi:isocitrate/isopropylmalate family dehydrogenase [Corynebacterium sp. H113]|uniref:isocitrate/isopropylmalate family dehydrogenase n=1 Tax=Corynebacterium sp. H113 TaxID=3133419 RepID=UPI0030B5D9D6
MVSPQSSQSPQTASIALLPGDGIGPEIVTATLPLLRELFPSWSFTHADIGWDCWCAEGDPIPKATWDILDSADAALMAAITSKPAAAAQAELAPELRDQGFVYRSPVLQLRQRLDLFANVRPISAPAEADESWEFVVMRENTEGLYSHDMCLDEHPELHKLISDDVTVRESTPAETAVALRVTTKFGWERLLRRAAETAVQRHDQGAPGATLTVTIAEKPNVLRESGAIVQAAMDTVAAEFPQVTFEMENADAVAMYMVLQPERFDVIAAENLIGDVLSDLGAGLMGGLGLPASANIGENFAMFEPIHGSAPDIAGQGIANPSAFLLSAAMCAEHLGTHVMAAQSLRSALRRALATHPTPDQGGTATTAEFVATVRAELTS